LARHCLARTRFPQYAAARDRAGAATSNHDEHEFIRDLPYLHLAFRSLHFAAGDDATMAEYDMPIEEQIKQLAREFKTFGSKLDTVDRKVDAVDRKVDKVQILLEQTHSVATLGLEGLQGLRESMDEKFESAATHNDEQTELLKSLVVHVRKRVERIEPSKRRRP
jgi:hypothetical protein